MRRLFVEVLATILSIMPESMLYWFRLKAYRWAVSAAFFKKYGIDIIALAEHRVGLTMTTIIVETVYRDLPLATLEGGEQIARILEQTNNIPINAIIRNHQAELMIAGKWDRDFTEVPFK